MSEPDRNDGSGKNCAAQIPQVREGFLENGAVVQPGDDDHLAMELDTTFGEASELIDDIGNARVIEEHLARFPVRRVDGDVQR